MRETRHQFRDDLKELERRTLEGLDLVGQGAGIGPLNREIFNRAVEIGDHVDAREWAMFMILVARAVERIADNAVEIAEQTVFVVTGLFREFAVAPQPAGKQAAGSG